MSCNDDCRTTTSYDVTSTAGQGNTGIVPWRKDVTCRQLFNTSGVDLYVGFTRPSNATGRWTGAFPCVNADKTTIYQSGVEIFFRPQSGSADATATIVEEFRS